MKEFIEKLLARVEEDTRIYIDCDGKMSLAIPRNKAVQSINEVAEEYNVGWISVKDRLPDKHQKVLVTYEDIYENDTYYVCDGMYVYDFDKWNISDFSFKDSDDFKVLAWQPLPPAYKPKGE